MTSEFIKKPGIPLVSSNVLGEADFSRLKETFAGRLGDFPFSKEYSRYFCSEKIRPILTEYSNRLLPLARKIFNNPNLLSTYSVFVHYEGPEANLPRHKDDNACTYTLDLCVYQRCPWPLWVDGKCYSFSPNEAVAYYGNHQEHWREEFPEKDTNQVGLVFFHYADPDHWFFNKKPTPTT